MDELILFCYDHRPQLYERLSRRPQNSNILISTIIRQARKTGQGEALVDLLLRVAL
ncbi:hypothetical protein QUF63_14545 [Anaerolineales bacterium HSG25]|nr:hypothetical protein [Anaerolineales bacterium HSG25]